MRSTICGSFGALTVVVTLSDDDSAGRYVHRWTRTLAARCPGITHSHLLVGVLLAGWADVDTGANARPSLETLAAAAGCNERTVRRALDTLERSGAIRCTGRRHRVKVWQLVTGHQESGYEYTKPDMPDVVTGHQESGDDYNVTGHSPVNVTGHSPVNVTGHSPVRQPTRPSRPTTSARGQDSTALPDSAGDDVVVVGVLDAINAAVPGQLRVTATRQVSADVAQAIGHGWSPDGLVAAVCSDVAGIRTGGALALRLHSLAAGPPPPKPTPTPPRFDRDALTNPEAVPPPPNLRALAGIA